MRRSFPVLFLSTALGCMMGNGCGVEPRVACATDEDCFAGYACDASESVCRRACTTASVAEDCLASQVCDDSGGGDRGVCRGSETNES